MERQSWRIAVALLATALLPVVLAASPTTITVLHLNDTHSHLDAFGYKDLRLDGTIGGLAKAVTVIQREKEQDPNALLLHAGDAFVGDFFFNRTFGVAELSVLKSLGLDAMTVGNHEFDLGPGVLTYALSQLEGGPPTMLSANLDTRGCATASCAPLQSWIQPSTIIERGGVKIGIFGLTTPNDPTAQPSPAVIQYAGAGKANQLIGTALVTAGALRAAGAQVVILLSHLGWDYDAAIAANQPILPAPVSAPLVNFIVGGHDHLVLEQPVVVNGTPIVSAGEFYKYVGRLRFTVDGPAVAFQDYALLPVDREVRPDATVQAQVNALKRQIVAFYKENVYKQVIGWATRSIQRDPVADSPSRDSGMGNLIADSYRFKTHSDIALVAAGYVSDRIYAGPVVGADLFRTVPYGLDPVSYKDCPLVVFSVKGSELWKGLEISLATGLRAFFLEVSGLKYVYDSTRPPLARVVELTVDGEPIDPAATYTVTANYIVAMIAQQGMGLQFEGPPTMAGLTEYDALRDFVAHKKVLWKESEGRIVDVAMQP